MNWTPDRPTKPGKYWVSVHPDSRGILFEAGVYEVVLWAADQKVRHVGGLTIVPEDRLIGALWRPYVEPADPHVRYQQEEERDELLRKPRLSRTDQARLQELNDALRTESPEERKYLDILRRAAAHRESLRSRIEALPDLVLGSGRVIGGAVDRGAVLALLDEVTR